MSLPKAHLSVHLLILYGHVISFIMCVINWWYYVKKHRNLYGDGWVDAHVAFQVIGGIAVFVSSPVCYWAYMYGSQMPPSRRRDFTALYIIISFLLFAFPLWIIEFSLSWLWGMQNVLQGISLVILSIVTFVGFMTTWLYYAWTAARICQKYFGSYMRDLHPVGGTAFSTAGRRARSGPPERI